MPPLPWIISNSCQHSIYRLILGLVLVAGLGAQTVHTELLDSGLTLITRRHSLTHAVQARLLVRASPNHEEDLLGSGVSELVRRLVEDRFRRLSDGRARLQSSVASDVVTYAVTTTDEHLPHALALLFEAVRLDDLGNDQVVAQRTAQLAELARHAADPEAVERRLLRWTVYRQHPDRLPVLGLSAQLRDLEPVTVRAYHRRHYTAPNMALVVVGNLSREWVQGLVVERTTSLPVGRWPQPEVPDEPLQQAERIVEGGPVPRERELLVWRTMPLSWRGAVFEAPVAGNQHRTQHHLAVMTVLEELLNHPEASPLLRALSAGRLASAVGVEHRIVPDHSGWFAIAFDPDPDKGPEALLAVQRVLGDLKDNGPAESDLQAAKASLMRRMRTRLNTVDGLAGHLARWWRANGEPQTGADFLHWVDEVQAADIRATVGLWLQPVFRNRSRIVLQPATTVVAAAERPKTAQADVPPRLVGLTAGAQLLSKDLSQYGLVHLGVTMGGGWSIETPEIYGGVGLLARLLAYGSESRNGADLDAFLAATGMTLQVQSLVHGVHVDLTCFPEQLPDAIRLLVDIVKSPALPKEHLEALIRERQADLALNPADVPWDRRLLAAVRRERMTDHYASRDGRGTRESLGGFTRATLLDLHRRLSVGGNLMFHIYGDLGDTEETTQLLKAALGADPVLASGEQLVPSGAPWETADQEGGAVSLAWQVDAGALALSWRGPSLERVVDDGPAMDVLTRLLTGPDAGGGRLGAALDAIDGLQGHHLRVDTDTYADRGLWTVLVRFDDPGLHARVQEAVRGVVADLAARVADAAAVSDAELEAARQACITRYDLALEDQTVTARVHALAALRGNLTNLHHYPKRVPVSTKREDLARVAGAYLTGAPLVIQLARTASEQPGMMSTAETRPVSGEGVPPPDEETAP